MNSTFYGFPVNFNLTAQQLLKQTIAFPMALVKIHKVSTSQLLGVAINLQALRFQFHVDEVPVCQMPVLGYLFVYGMPFTFIHPIIIHDGQVFTVTVQNSLGGAGLFQFYFDGEIIYGQH
jgi:hypothetical protein